MNEYDFNRLIENAMSDHPIWFELNNDRKIIELEDIEKIEQKNGLIYPIEYKKYLSRYGAGEFALTKVYSPTDDPYSSWLHKEKYHLPDDFFPISDNGCGDYLGFVVAEGQCSEEVYWADHEQGYSIVYQPAFDSFYRFIIKIGLNT